MISRPMMKPASPTRLVMNALLAALAALVPLVVEADQQIRADADQFPAHEHLEQVVGQDQVEHREAEQRQEQEEPAKPAAAMQMAVLGVDLVILDDRSASSSLM